MIVPSNQLHKSIYYANFSFRNENVLLGTNFPISFHFLSCSNLRIRDALTGVPETSKRENYTNCIPHCGRMSCMVWLYCRVTKSKGSCPANRVLMFNTGEIYFAKISISKDVSITTFCALSLRKYSENFDILIFN